MFSACSSETEQEVHSFRIKITRVPAFSPAAEYTVWPDSVLISYPDHATDTIDTLVQHWTPDEKAAILKMIESWTLDSIAPEDPPANVSDATAFFFSVQVDSLSRDFRVYRQTISEFYALAKLIDASLPEKARINYTGSR
jgi:hypothetical protein